MGKLQFRISSWMNYRAIKFKNFVQKFTWTDYIQVHLTLLAWERCWMNHHFPFLIHWWCLWLITFLLNHRTASSSNWKKSRVVVCPRMRIYRDEFLETEKREQNEKKKSLTPFGYLANVQNYLFLLPRETNLIFNIGK